MPANDIFTPPPRWIRPVRILGYLVFLVAFFLPAVREPASGETHRGWFCAGVTLINSLNRDFWRSKEFLAILSGWINPLMLLHVASLFSRKLRIFRRIVSILIVLFIPGTWVFFYLEPLTPLIGHFLWIVGILMILAGETVRPVAPSNE